MKKAIRRLVRGDDGKLRIIFIDLNTLQEVTDTTGYTIISAGSASEEPDPVADVSTPGVPSTVQPDKKKEPVNSEADSDESSALSGTKALQFPEVPPAPTENKKSGTSTPTPTSTGQTTPKAGFATPTSVSAPQTYSPPSDITRSSLDPVMTPAIQEARADQSLMKKDLQTPVGKEDPRLASGVGLIENWGPHRPNAPDESIMNPVSESISKTQGSGYSIAGVSGQEGDLPQYGSHRHKTGTAIDFDVIGPDGQKITDPVQIQRTLLDFVKTNPQAGVGFGEGYMTPGRSHLDLAGPPSAWGAGGAADTMNPVFAREIDYARQGMDMPIPTPDTKPGVAERTGFASADKEQDKSVADAVIQDAKTPASLTNVVDSETVARDEARSFADKSPAYFAASGLVDRSAEQVATIAKALSGELSGEQLRALEASDPVAQKELANMVTTVENRAASKMYGSLEKALTPSQYNSLYDSKSKVTNENYALHGGTVEKFITDYYKGTYNDLVDDWTKSSYYNPTISDPSWGAKMSNPADVGDHRFGSLSEYGPSDDFKAQRSSFATYGDREARNTFGTTESSGYGRSSLGQTKESDSSGFADRSSRGTFGTTESPGYGRSSYDSGDSSSYDSGDSSYSSHAAERERDTSLGSTSSKSSSSSSSNSSTSRSTAPSSGGYSGSPTNDDDGSSKTPGGGF